MSHFNIINKFFIPINKIINSIDKKTVNSIKRGYLFLIFILCILAAIIGFGSGKDSAKIPSEPLVNTNKDLFEYEVMRKRKHFLSVDILETDRISEIKSSKLTKKAYLTREKMPIYTEKAIIDPPINSKIKHVFDVLIKDKQFETGEEKSILEPEVKKLPKDDVPLEMPRESVKIIEDSKPMVRDIPFKKSKETIKIPKPIINDSGIIKNEKSN